jgi:hypothetical protein
MESRLNRRRFAAVVLTAGGSTAALSADPAPERPNTSLAASADDSAQPAVVEVALEDLMLLALLRRYPMSELTEARALGLRAGLRRNIDQGDLLRQVGLGNGDEPATVFRALR